MEEFSAPLADDFQNAVNYLNRSKHLNPSTEQKLSFYKYYKQATIGPCNTKKPGIFEFTERTKWDAWNSLGTLTKEDSMQRYIKQLEEVEPKWKEKSPATTEAQASTTAAKSDTGLGGPVFSRPSVANDVALEKRDLCYWTAEGNIEKVREILKNSKDKINVKDEEGCAPLHYACDRGNVEIAQLLIENGADVNLQDSQGQTGLHYGATVGEADIISLLLKAGADPTIATPDGETPLDVASEDEIKALFQ
eukprot:TRINITY_DN4242_c0_g1_i1.p1 TRINITY_DN4242_c0_g1~~TRINITY_DN4242_c0_g1_i1.p1  ORF type:complete len:250 (+),score=49.46 TRINITY_DN4242_c0_g1_i1:92-841(+)